MQVYMRISLSRKTNFWARRIQLLAAGRIVKSLLWFHGHFRSSESHMFSLLDCETEFKAFSSHHSINEMLS